MSGNLWPVMDFSEPQSAAPVAGYTWVADATTFRALLEQLSGARRFALDIEADSLYHYYEKVCLIQISTDRENFVVDPLSLRDLGPLGDFLADNSVEKVLHAAAYDLLSLGRDHGFSCANIFDTHIAAQLLGYDQLGLSSLLEKLLGIHHSKHRQKDDWSIRPLDSDQLAYAVRDTCHLLAVRDRLESELHSKGRLEWALEEFEAAARAIPQERSFDPDGFRKIPGSRALAPAQISILQALYFLRDRLARELDVPPFKVMNNSVLIDLALKPPSNPQSLHSRPGISNRVARKYGREVCDHIQEAIARDPEPSTRARRNQWKPLGPEAKERLERLKGWRKAKAEALGLHVGVVFPGTLLEAFAATPPGDADQMMAVPGMRRWRRDEFGAEILSVLRSR